jgi:hypothetical protein
MVETRVTNLVNPSYGSPKKTKKKGSTQWAGHRSRSNPLALTLGAINPIERSHSGMATKKKTKKSPSKSKGHKNTYSVKTLKTMLVKKGGKFTKRSGGSRNPAIFGVSRPAQIGGVLLGISVGVTIAKLVPPMLPAAWTASDGGRFLTTAGVALAVGVAAHFALPAPYRDSLAAGAGSQALSVGLNPILRKVSSNFPTLGSVRRNALGDFVAASFPEPNNPIFNRMLMAGMATAPGATSSGGNLGRYRSRYN